MRTPHSQRGLGWYSLIYILATLGLFVLIGIKSFPIYMNEYSIRSVTEKVAASPGVESESIGAIRRRLQKFWDINDISSISPNEVRMVREGDERFLAYAYERDIHLFLNVTIVYSFSREIPIGG